jgi:pimeloyl-ACP methyl ester carboxylesterase
MEFVVPDAGHFPWIESPAAVRTAFTQFTRSILARSPQQH